MTKKEIEQEMKKYEEMNFNNNQMHEIRLGLEAGLNVTKYADPKFNDDLMEEIRWSLNPLEFKSRRK